VRVAGYFARRQPAGLTHGDLGSAADEAIVLAVCTHDPSKMELEKYVWLRVRQALKTLIRRRAEELGLCERRDSHASRMAQAGRDALDEYGLALEDPGDAWEDTIEDLFQQFDDVCDEAAAALALGAAGRAWHMRGEEAWTLRAEYVRAIKVLHDEVAALPSSCATIIELRFFREMKIEDVARTAGVSVQKVTRLIGEALPLLRARLKARAVGASALDGA
jgi:DNA-directed RNA polymerase specialized sigma subunit